MLFHKICDIFRIKPKYLCVSCCSFRVLMSDEYINLETEVSKSLIFKVIKIIFGFFSIIIISRFLSLSLLGEYFIAITFIEAVNQVCSGLDAAVQKRCSEEGGKSGEILTVSIGIYVAYLVILFPILYFTKDFLFEIISIETHLFLPIYLGIATLGIFRISNNYLSGIGFPGRSVAIVAGKNFMAFVLHTSFLLLGLGVYYLVLTEFIVAAIASLIILLHKRPRIAIGYDTIKDVIEFSKWSVPNSILSILTHRIDVFVLAIFIGASSVGIYQAAYKIFLPTIMIATSFSSPLVVKISNLHSKGLEFKSQVNKVLSYAGLLPIPLLFGSILLRDRIMVLLYGFKFVDTGLIVVLISLYVLISVYRRQFMSILYGIDKPQAVFKIQTLYFLINTPLSIYGAIEFGIVGVIIMTMISEVITLGLYYYLQKENIGGYTFKSISKQIYSSMIMSLVLIPLVFLIPATPTFYTIPIVILGGIIYIVSLSKLLPEFRNLVYRQLRKVK